MTSLHERMLPELLLLESIQERKRLLRRVRNTRSVIAVATVFGVANLALFILMFDYIRALGLSRSLLILLYMAYVIATLSAPTWFMRRAIRRQIRVQLTQRGIPICIPCGYDLTGNVSGVCPECGMNAEG